MPDDVNGGSTYERIYAVVRRIPRGKVSTYGRVAELAGLGRAARQVGYAMAALPDHTTVPWHRVINAQGRISLRRGTGGDLEQRYRLEAEGVVFDSGGRVSLERFGWNGGRKKRKKGGEVED
ncbi:MAG TPA: MGMT family protein [Longimicrobium sp.]|nr:MGMT family protein [Longimicrobium sp.]